jgi:hypothetical protein
VGLKIEKLIREGLTLREAWKKVRGRYLYSTIVRYHLHYRREAGQPMTGFPSENLVTPDNVCDSEISSRHSPPRECDSQP